jgi:hypothetical protein
VTTIAKNEYELKGTDPSIPASPVPFDIQEAIIRDAKRLPPTSWLFQQDFCDKIATGTFAFWQACRTLMMKTHPLATLAITWNDIYDERATWSKSQQIAYAAKEALKPLFTNGSSFLMQECAKHFGAQFVEFVRSAFVSELTGFLIEYLADQLYVHFGGGGGNGGKNFDLLMWLEELVIFLLCYFLVLLLCRMHPDMSLLKNFFDIIIPMFVKYLISKLRSKK